MKELGYTKKIWIMDTNSDNSSKCINMDETINYSNCLNKWVPENPSHIKKQNYRLQLNTVYKNKCLISNVDISECEGAHIVPRHICQELNLKFIYHYANGILLARNIHTSFDNYIWTFDIWDYQVDLSELDSQNKPKSLLLSIIVASSDKNYTILKYKTGAFGQKNYFKLPIESLPYLFIHYTIFMMKNYHPPIDDSTLYRETLSNPIFTEMVFNPSMFLNIANKLKDTPKTCHTILSKRYSRTSTVEYLSLWEYHPFDKAEWVTSKSLLDSRHRTCIADYEHVLSLKTDPDV